MDWDWFITGFCATACEFDHSVEDMISLYAKHIVMKITDEDSGEDYKVKIRLAGKLRNGPQIFEVQKNNEKIAHVSTPRAAFAVLYC